MKKLVMLSIISFISVGAFANTVYFYNGSRTNPVQFYCSRSLTYGPLFGLADSWYSASIPERGTSSHTDTYDFGQSDFLQCYAVNPDNSNANLTDPNNQTHIFFDNQGNASVAYYDGGQIDAYLGAKTWFK